MGEPKNATHVQPVILSGGAGTRLWPLSRALRPKQFMPLGGTRPMIVETALRTAGTAAGVQYSAPMVVCNEEHRFAVGDLLAEANLHPSHIILEPMGRNTAAAIALAALAVVDTAPETLLLVMPSDHVIGDLKAFQTAVAQAARVAQRGFLLTFGIQPTEPHTGYGYIRAGEALEGAEPAFRVERFIEKPSLETAQSLLAAGGYTWNSGIFLFPAALFLQELDAHAPAILAACRQAWASGHRDLDFCRLKAEAFAQAPSQPVDIAVLEQSDRVAVIPVEMQWNDVGAWNALWDIGQKDLDGNVCEGDVLTMDSENCYIRSENGGFIAVSGLKDVVVVATDDAVLVSDRDSVQNVKKVVDELAKANRSEGTLHSTVHRPWGTYRGIDRGARFQVKQIVVKPGAKLSLQYHHHRAEHWIVVEGTARVTCGERTFLLRENESTYIPIGCEHRLENPGTIPLRLIEVQSGTYLGEDDIVRVEDTYGRVP